MNTAPSSASPTTLTINGVTRSVPPRDAGRPLLWYLRDRLGLKGTKFGCGHGGCGACTVQIDGTASASCTVTVREAAGKDITTIEGLAKTPDRDVFKAWLAEQVPQCGYCQPGMLVAAATLLERVPDPDDAQINEAFAHVLCRCGSYQRVRDAVHRAAAKKWEDAPFPAIPLPPPPVPARGTAYRFNPWVTISSGGTVTVTIERSEMGQGVNTALAMLVAEELDVSLDRVRTVFAPVDHAYDNPVIKAQITVGSMSVHNAWLRMRGAGADVRTRLVAAAAAAWGVTAASCRTENGDVLDAGGRRRDYGTLAAAASALPETVAPVLKTREAFRLLGKATARLEIPGHMAGRSIFGMDVTLPNMRAATMLLPPALGATVNEIDASRALAIDGVRDVFAIGDGVAIVADDVWLALCARDAVDVTWSRGHTEISSASIRRRLHAALEQTGTVQRETGDIAHVLDMAATVVAAEYETPYVAHAPIEPMNCTVRLTPGRCEVWMPTQGQTMAQAAAATAAGLPLDAVSVHTTFLGGGFGRRSVPDVVTEAVQIAKRAGVPIQLVWTRADDVQHDRFRPVGAALVRGVLDEQRRVGALHLRIAGPQLAFDGVDLPYDVPNVRVECVEEDPRIPTGYWRSVGASQNAFVIESFIDELAHAAQQDPVAFRLAHLHRSDRHRAVLELASVKADWGKPAAGRSQGVAIYYAHGGWTAEIAEISIEGGRVIVHRVVCAVDCGFAVNPDTVRAQVEGGIAFGLTAALKASVTIEAGRVQQTGFRDYPLLTMAEMPRIEVHLIDSKEPPSGAGECGVPPIAPAVANAVFASTGRRIRTLPLRFEAPDARQALPSSGCI